MGHLRVVRRPRRRGFSLIELLVVLAIIAVLAGLTVFALTRARRQAERIETRANRRQGEIYEAMREGEDR